MANVDWAAVKSANEQKPKSHYRNVWQKPELNQKGFFLMKLDVEPKEIFISYDPTTKKYTEHEHGGPGINRKIELGLHGVEGQDVIRVSKGFVDKLLPDIAEYVKENPEDQVVRVNVRTVMTTNGNATTLDFINCQKP